MFALSYIWQFPSVLAVHALPQAYMESLNLEEHTFPPFHVPPSKALWEGDKLLLLLLHTIISCSFGTIPGIHFHIYNLTAAEPYFCLHPEGVCD